MDLRQLEVFAKVYELRSFSKAAQSLFLTQPTVSERIGLLEDELSLKLFDRTGRETIPTRAGDLLFGYAKRILSLNLEAKHAIDQFVGKMAGELAVGGSTIPGEYVLPALIGRFKEKYPEISVSLLIRDTQGILDLVKEGQVEFGVVGAKINHRSLEYSELMTDDLVLIVPPHHPWWGKDSVTLGELRAAPLVIREKGSGTRHSIEQALEQAGIEWESLKVIGEMGSTQAIKEAVKAGVGLSVVSKRAVGEECKHKLLWGVKVQGLNAQRYFYVVTHRERTRSPLAEAFLTFLRPSV
ncbi:MAG TPA: selenium metabolism-associated LysR family transcriptional regulator [Methylomirabilota bacterium]|nr:selenium metabolism-associated LysR family transcriptional regulator [Methylomirabilota bacterium]